MEIILITLAFLLLPALVIYLCHISSFINKFGAILLCYAVGLILGNTGILCADIEPVQKMITTFSIPLAIPLLLFSLNIRAWFSMAGKTLLSMVLGIICLLITVVGGFYLFGSHIDGAWQVAGMFMGVYTGGTPNLAALGTALNVPPDLFIAVNAYDMVISVIYLFFLISIGQRFFLLYLPKFQSSGKTSEGNTGSSDIENPEAYSELLQRKMLLPIAKALGLSVLILAIGGGVSELVPESASTAVAILLITTLGIACSLIPAVHNITKTFQVGMYFILVFSLTISSMADVSKIVSVSSDLLIYVVMAIFGTLVLHSLLGKLFRIDADTMMITSTALICSPPFVPTVAAAIKNKEVIISGLTVGIIGYAIGNYLGITVAYLLK